LITLGMIENEYFFLPVTGCNTIWLLAIMRFLLYNSHMIQTNDTKKELYTLVLTNKELELLYDRLNNLTLNVTVKQFVLLRRSINDKVYKITL